MSRRDRSTLVSTLLGAMLVLIVSPVSWGQKPPDPELSYVFPPGGRAGTSVDVQLGGADWTPDVEFIVHDDRVRLEILGPMGKLIPPAPPHFIGVRAYDPLPLPREVPARLTFPADLPPGVIHWQVANANGSSRAGVFVIGDGLEVIEDEKVSDAQPLPSLPVTVSGRLSRNEEVDRYVLKSMRSGPVTVDLMARRVGSRFNGVIEVHDASGSRVAESIDTPGHDTSLTFVAEQDADYELRVRDLDFRGHRSFAYRLTATPGPRVLASLPLAGKRGETRDVEFIGIGVATGRTDLESVIRSVTFPDDPDRQSFQYQLETPHGTAPAVTIPLANLSDGVLPPPPSDEPRLLSTPAAVSCRFDDRFKTHRYRFESKQGERWAIDVQADRVGSPLDLKLVVSTADGTKIAENDDLPGTTDAGLEFIALGDGSYQIELIDLSGIEHTAASVYRLAIEAARADFWLETAQRLNVSIAGTAALVVKTQRTGGFDQPIALSVTNLPQGVSVSAEPVIPAGQTECKVTLTAAEDAPSGAALASVSGNAEIDGQNVTRTAVTQPTGSLTPRMEREHPITGVLIATTMKPRVRIWPIESDERTVHRGTTHLAPIGIERLEGFQGEVIVQMEGTQPQKFRQGILGPDVIVPTGRDRVFYPCFVPHHAETLDAYRFSLAALAKVPDPRGNVRYLLTRMPRPDETVAITVEGGLLNLACAADLPLSVRKGAAIEIPLSITRSPKLTEPVQIELRLPENGESTWTAEPLVVTSEQTTAVLRVKPRDGLSPADSDELVIQATALQPGGELPALTDAMNCTPLDPKMVEILKAGSLPVFVEISVPISIVAR